MMLGLAPPDRTAAVGYSARKARASSGEAQSVDAGDVALARTDSGSCGGVERYEHERAGPPGS